MIKQYRCEDDNFMLEADPDPEAKYEGGGWVKYPDINEILISYAMATEMMSKKVKELEATIKGMDQKVTVHFDCLACHAPHDMELKVDPCHIVITRTE